MENQEKPLSVDEEYDLWKSNVPLMYDFVSETRLTWPSLTVQWLPTPVQELDGGFIKQELIIGTHTSGEEENYLKFAELIYQRKFLVMKTHKKKQERSISPLYLLLGQI